MNSPVSLELQSKIAAWRLKAADGTLTLEEMKEGIALLRGGRCAAAEAAQANASKRKRAIAEIPSAEDMLSELGDL